MNTYLVEFDTDEDSRVIQAKRFYIDERGTLIFQDADGDSYAAFAPGAWLNVTGGEHVEDLTEELLKD